MTPRKLTAAEVEFEVIVEPEHTHLLRAIAQENWIQSELDRGNDLAWCWVRVVARWEGMEGDDSLACVSCRNQRELEEVFLPEMRANALNSLNAEVARLATRIEATL